MNTSQKLQPHFYFGESVDRYLESEGAIAQAVDRDTIVLSSSVFAMGEAERSTVILHELAHTQQLARSGSDPVSALEDEAWEAAEAWSQDKPFEVRGRASTRLNAVAIIQGGEHGKNASSWYISNPIEPIGGEKSLAVKSSVVLPDTAAKPLTLEAILDTIIAKNERQVVIVCHGTEFGIMPHLYAGSDYASEGPNLVRLSSDKRFKKGGIDTMIIPDDEVFRGAKVENITRLREKMNQVRDMHLEHVAFRACNMGKNQDTLDAFRDFFGATSVSARKILDTYGHTAPSMTQDLQTWVTAMRKHVFRCWIDKNVAFAIKPNPRNRIEYQVQCRALNKTVLGEWVRKHVANTLAGNNAFVFHGVADETVADKEAPVIFFVRDQEFLLNIVNYQGA